MTTQAVPPPLPILIDGCNCKHCRINRNQTSAEAVTEPVTGWRYDASKGTWLLIPTDGCNCKACQTARKRMELEASGVSHER